MTINTFMVEVAAVLRAEFEKEDRHGRQMNHRDLGRAYLAIQRFTSGHADEFRRADTSPTP